MALRQDLLSPSLTPLLPNISHSAVAAGPTPTLCLSWQAWRLQRPIPEDDKDKKTDDDDEEEEEEEAG